jgi:hypothetical protein
MGDKHTPTPWRYRDCPGGPVIESEAEWFIEPTDGEDGIPTTVINLHGAMGGNPDADIELIVTAVNYHEPMVAMLRRAHDYLGRISDTQYPGSLDLWLEIKQALAELDAGKDRLTADEQTELRHLATKPFAETGPADCRRLAELRRRAAEEANRDGR